MNGNCHFIFGACTGVTTSLLLNAPPTTTALLVSTCLIGSIFPDIDNPKSHFGQLTKPVSSLIGKTHEFLGKQEYEHRGIFHHFEVWLGLFFLSLLYFPYLLGFFVGGLSHLLLDSFNPVGVPVVVSRMRLARIRSGSTGSICVTAVLSFVMTMAGVLCRIEGITIL